VPVCDGGGEPPPPHAAHSSTASRVAASTQCVEAGFSRANPHAGLKAADAKLLEIAQLPIEIVGVDMELGKSAASLKAEHNLPYADCFAAALAQSRKGALVTSDKKFQRATPALKILWV
jgi:predicted nucleic acid-binding protein